MTPDPTPNEKHNDTAPAKGEDLTNSEAIGYLRAELALEQAKVVHLRGEVERNEISVSGALQELKEATDRASDLEKSLHRRESLLLKLERELESARAHIEIARRNADALEAAAAQAARLEQALEHSETHVRSLQGELKASRKHIDATKNTASHGDAEWMSKLEALALQMARSQQELDDGIKRISNLQAMQEPLERVIDGRKQSWTKSAFGLSFSNLFQAKLPGKGWFSAVWAAPSPNEQGLVILKSNLFDSDWYVRKYPEVAKLGIDPILHYITRGAQAGMDPGPAFSTTLYLESNPEVRAAGTNPLYHYIVVGRHQGRAPSKDAQYVQGLDQTTIVAEEFDDDFYRDKYRERQASPHLLEQFMRRGWKDGRDPHPQFSTQYYLKENPDVLRSGINPYVHYLIAGRHEGRLPREFSGLSHELNAQWRVIAREFDVKFYRKMNPDVVQKRFEPILHYLLEGWKQERDPHPEFSTAHYLDTNSDVRAARINPYFHFLAEGRREGRSSRPAGSWAPRSEVRRAMAGEFDTEFYFARNPDVRDAGADALEHFLEFGWKEGRDPNANFSTQFYLDANDDVAAAGINPFYHFLVAGRAEGRLATHPGGWRVAGLLRLTSIDRQIECAIENAPMNRDLLDENAIHSAIGACGHEVGMPILLTLSHDDYTSSVGGVQLCIKLDEQNANSRGMTHINLHPTLPLNVLSRDRTGEAVTLVVTCNGKSAGIANSNELLRALGRLAQDSKRTFLAVHSLLSHSTEMVICLHAVMQPARSFMWLHDFFSVCPSYTLLRNGISFCHAPHMESSGCGLCVFGDERREHSTRFQHLFAHIPFEVIAPSQFAADYWSSKSNLAFAKLHVMEHCSLVESECAQEQSDGPVRVAFLGHPSSHKGWETFVKVLGELQGDARYEFHHLGAGSRCDNRTVFSRVSVLEDGPNAMTNALIDRKIDMTVLWSIWPETFSFVAHESIGAGASILTCEDSGNISRLVQERGCGAVFRDESALLDAFRCGDIVTMARNARAEPRRLYAAKFSGMTIPLVDQDEVR